MDNDIYKPAIRQVVRKYSLKVAEETPDDTLSQALGEVAPREIPAEEQQQQERFDSWQAWLRSEQPGHIESLGKAEERSGQVVGKLWAKFHFDLNLGDALSDDDGPPGLDTLWQAVRGAEAAWAKQQESGLGKTRSAVTNFLSALNDYSYLFSVIPNGDKYTSLITGVITSVVKSSVNHKKVAEQFSEALNDITEDLRTVRKSVAISDSLHMRLFVIDLYVNVFSFLCAAMNWYEKRLKRFVVSFNKNYATNIQQKVNDIKKVLDRIRLEASQVTQDRIQDTQQSVKSIDKGVNNISHGIEDMKKQVMRELQAAGERSREYATGIEKQLKELRESFLMALGHNATQSLLATGQATEYNQRMDVIGSLAIEWRKKQTLEVMTSADGDGVTISKGPPDALSSNTRDEIRERAAPYLRAFLLDGRPEVLKTGTSTRFNALLPAEVTQKIGRWIGDSSSRFLWVEGPVYVLAEQQLSLTAVQICDLALRARNPVPCVLFTPPMSHQTLSSSATVPAMSKQEKVLISLLYHIANQLIHLLPEELNSTTGGLDAQAFESLNGSFASASAALDLIQVLLAYSPPTLIIIIDKLQLAECSATISHLERFITLLRDRSQSQIIKALFITGGSSRVLARTLDSKTEKMDARRMVQARPGQPLRGWSSMGNLNILN